MAASDAYSRYVLFAKISLPLTALAILSTLFLFSGGVDPTDAIPFADVNVEEIAREQRLTNARYGSVTPDGTAIALAAGEARPDPDNPQIMRANIITGSIELSDGSKIELLAGGAVIDLTAQTAGLTDQVYLVSTLGLNVEAGQVMAHLDDARLRAKGPVKAETPFGDLEAGNMLLTRGPESDPAYRLVFNERVRLLYRPERQDQ